MVNNSGEEVDDLATRYRDVLVEMDGQRTDHGGKPRSWNRLVDRMQLLQLRLRATQAGREAITALIEDENPTVRLWSSVNALVWAENLARVQLMRESEDSDGFHGLEARTALREFDKGRLDTTWDPSSR